MTEPAVKATIEFDHHSADYAVRWREINADHRRRCPVAHTEAHGGFWQLSRYDDVARVARDDARFSSWWELEDGTHQSATIPPSAMRQVPIEMDPPEFDDYRKLLNPKFSPAMAKKSEPYIRDVTTYCIDQFIESGTCDLVSDLASAVPAIFTMEFLGLPKDNWRPFSDAAHTAIHTVPGEPEHEAALQEIFAMVGQAFEIINARRAEPRDDLISYLVHSHINNEPISDERLIQILTLVIFGGVDTTGALLSSVLEWLGRHHDVREELRADPSLIPQATEEFLRYFAPVQGLSRTAKQDSIIGDQRVATGEQVMLSWAAANFDDEVFEDPDRLDIRRFPNRHQSFGVGIHRCLGSNIARVEFAVMLEEILRRLPDYEIGDGAQRYRSIAVVNGWVNLPATFTPGPRENPAIDL